MIDLKDFYSAGYYLIRPNDPDWGDWRAGLLPEKLVSLSGCIGRIFSVMWGLGAIETASILKFGIPEEQHDNFAAWCEQALDVEIDLSSMFYSTEAARRFIQRFDLPREELHIIGVGLPRQPAIYDDYLAIPQSSEQDGIEKEIKRTRSLEDGGQALGFEIVSFDSQLLPYFSHSWLCSGLHEEMLKLFSIRPNACGLIDSQADALKVYEWIKEDDMQGQRGEPEPYFPWLLVDYPLVMSS